MLSVRALTSATSCSSQRLRSGGAGLNFKAWARRAAPQKPWQDERQERPNPFRAASASSTGLSGGFGAPLAERQDVHTVPLRDLLSWYCKAAEEAAEAAAELAGSPGDGKPDAGALEVRCATRCSHRALAGV